ncbi:MAG: helix-turn-helix domain-containing protein [Candidatus Thermoplasmatota archaeon]|nr:helix-turn-helix domain-containing protein [Candidatus Thermoplasmatota archaeon]
MQRLEYALEIKKTLQRSNFNVSEYCRSGTFNIVARKGSLLLFIKLLLNIGAIRYEIAKELKMVSKFLKGVPITICKRSGTSKIENGAVYLRHYIPIISERTFEELVIDNMPYVYAMPGGFYARIDFEKMKKIRRLRKISLGEIARAVGVSRKAVQLYEQGMKPEIETALRLESFIGKSILLPIDISSYTQSEERFETDLEKLEFFERIVFNRLSKLGYEVLPTSKSPFNGLTKNKKETFITYISENEKLLVKKIRVIASISNVIKRMCVFFVKNSDLKNFSGIPIITWKDLKATSPKAVREIILERAKKWI